MKNEIQGMSLFNDVEDYALRIRNRAVVMANVAEANTKQKKITQKGTYAILSYFNAIPENEKKDSYNSFKNTMMERGYSV